MNENDAPRTYGYCPKCLHAVSLKEETCHRCGFRFVPGRGGHLVFTTIAAALLILYLASMVNELWVQP